MFCKNEPKIWEIFCWREVHFNGDENGGTRRRLFISAPIEVRAAPYELRSQHTYVGGRMFDVINLRQGGIFMDPHILYIYMRQRATVIVLRFKGQFNTPDIVGVSQWEFSHRTNDTCSALGNTWLLVVAGRTRVLQHESAWMRDRVQMVRTCC